MKVMDMTLKEVYQYYISEKCETHCVNGSYCYCPLCAGNCCVCDIIGFASNMDIKENYRTQLGIEYDENLKVKDVVKILLNKEVE